MSSGCIVGECPVCGEIVWEDEWDIVGDIIIHETCRKAYFKATYHNSEQQFNRLMGAEELQKNIAEAKAQFAADIKLLEEGYGHQIEELEKRLKHLEKNKTSGAVAPTACERAAKGEHNEQNSR